MERREFLRNFVQGSGLLLAQGLVLPSIFLSQTAEASSDLSFQRYLVTAHTDKDLKHYLDFDKKISKPIDGEIHILDLAHQSLRKVDVPAYCHGFAQHPINTNVIFGVEKWGNRAIVFDLKTGKVLQSLKAPENFRYFGHGAFDPSGQKLYTSASRYDSNLNAVLVYNTKTWTHEQSIELGHVESHEIRLRDDGRSFLIATRFRHHFDNKELDSGGELVEINISDNKIIHRYPVPFADHILRISSDIYVVGTSISRPHSNAYAMDLKKGSVLDLRDASGYDPESMNGETLSAGKIDSDHVVMTIPASQMFFIWNIKTNQVIKQKAEGWDNGVAVVADSQFIVTSGDNGDIKSYKFISNKIVSPDDVFNEKKVKLGNGRHVYLFTS